jgi:hypothetical protein
MLHMASELMGYYEHGNELQGFIHGEEVFD